MPEIPRPRLEAVSGHLADAPDPALLAHATAFVFRPNFGDLNGRFHDDPEHRHEVRVERRGDERWAIRSDDHRCWSQAEGRWVYESGDRTEEFIAATRFSLDEAVKLVPGILARIEAEIVPIPAELVAARTGRADG